MARRRRVLERSGRMKIARSAYGTAESRKFTLANEFVASDKLAVFLIAFILLTAKNMAKETPSAQRARESRKLRLLCKFVATCAYAKLA